MRTMLMHLWQILMSSSYMSSTQHRLGALRSLMLLSTLMSCCKQFTTLMKLSTSHSDLRRIYSNTARGRGREGGCGTLPLLTTGTPIPLMRVFTTERSATPCLCRRANGWCACKARKAAPDTSRLLASVSVNDTGLQSLNLAEMGMLRDHDRDKTCDVLSARKQKWNSIYRLTNVLNERPVFLS